MYCTVVGIWMFLVFDLMNATLSHYHAQLNLLRPIPITPARAHPQSSSIPLAVLLALRAVT